MKNSFFMYSKKGLLILLSVLLVSTTMAGLSAIGVSAVTSADLSISQNGINFICEREQFHSKCYVDNTQSSIGFGTKCTGSAQQPHAAGMHTITREQALADMKSQINATYAPRVRNQTAGITMNQNQFDALVSLCYNTGGGTTRISNSPLVKYLRGELTEAQARSQYSNYIVTSGGKVLQGLINRRNAEADLFFTPSSSTPTQNDNFVYHIDGFAAIPGGVHINGWCFDKRTISQALSIHVYFGGPSGSAGAEGNPFTVANVKRTDVDNVHHCGENHGFSADVRTSKTGNVPVYLYAVNPANGESIELFSFTVNIPAYADFHYMFEDYRAVPGGVSVSGWCYDKNHIGSTLIVDVFVGGPAGTEGVDAIKSNPANKERTDVDNAYNCGANHGFEFVAYTSKRGRQPVYVYAYDTTSGSSTLMKSFTVDIPAPYDPEGTVDNLTVKPGMVGIDGWAFDRDDLSKALSIHVYIGGSATNANAEGHSGIKANVSRTDVDRVHNCGENHGFLTYVPTKKTGIQDVYVYAINVNGGSNKLIGSGQVAIPADTENPVVTETGIDRVSNDSFRVTVKAEDNAAIGRVEVKTWTREQSDLKTYNAVLGSNGEYYADIIRTNHSGTKNNLYHNHIFVYDYSGNVVKAVQDYDYAIVSDTGKNIAEGVYRIVSVADETKALDVQGASVDNNANIHVYSNLNDSKQTFEISYAGDGFYKIKNTYSGKYLDVYGGTYQNGTNVAQWDNNNDVGQQWKIQSTGDGFNLIARNNGLALTVESDDDVKVNTLTNAANQKWKLRRVMTNASYTVINPVILPGTAPVPKVTVKLDGRELTENIDYTVRVTSYSNGNGVVTVVGTGDYCDTKTLNFTYRERLLGDINLDGFVTIEDATALQRYLAKFHELNEEQLMVADVNQNGKININDVTKIQRIVAEIE